MWDIMSNIEFSLVGDCFTIEQTIVEAADAIDNFYTVVRRCPMTDYEWFFDTCKDSCPENTIQDDQLERCNYNLCDLPQELCD